MLQLPPLILTNGSTQALKWLALILMTGDHINKYLFNETLPYLFESGRLAMPIFVVILAYNLARDDTLQRRVHLRVIKRLAIFGAAASLPFIALGGLINGWYPLNILFMLLALTAVIYCIERRLLMAAALIFIVGGAAVEFWYPAIIFGLAVWFYARRPSLAAAIITLLSCSSLWFINNNLWALASLPIIYIASRYNPPIPRIRWLFYFYYPAHLLLLWLIRIPMSQAGYLFF